MTVANTRVTVRPVSRTRLAAVTAPLLLLFYGVSRLADGLDGDRGPGLAWNIGHTSFLISIVAFAVLAVELRRMLLAAAPRLRTLTDAATATALVGAASFLWVILGDLFAGFAEAAPLPDPLFIAGPMLFQLGLLTLLVLAATVRPRRLPRWAPPLVLVGFLALAANLDLLPVGAALIFAGLLPLRPHPDPHHVPDPD
ncbi:hypothetical protein E1211_31510 [Micromonospora sp. 15K316]|uniref:hypothetical protein n=1 Tax=Micromonospora sp. 15K316 TaxID=2530376 RepID=UPI0010456411|nr:hypothetical protein [Micromonospora sp. 15K316]TDC22314.1 hypothetical protein E1211_31510 [Micromonospora sp. 15K316]